MFGLHLTNPGGKQSFFLIHLLGKSEAQLMQRSTSRIFVPFGIRTLVLLLIPLSALPLYHIRGGLLSLKLKKDM